MAQLHMQRSNIDPRTAMTHGNHGTQARRRDERKQPLFGLMKETESYTASWWAVRCEDKALCCAKGHGQRLPAIEHGNQLWA